MKIADASAGQPIPALFSRNEIVETVELKMAGYWPAATESEAVVRISSDKSGSGTQRARTIAPTNSANTAIARFLFAAFVLPGTMRAISSSSFTSSCITACLTELGWRASSLPSAANRHPVSG